MKNIFKISILVLLISGISACDDKLEIENPNRSSDQGYYAGELEAVAAVNAIYNPLIIDGFFQRMMPMYNDGRSDELYSKSPWGFMIGFSNFTLPSTEPSLEIAWGNHYIMINYANQALENIPTIEGLDADLVERLLGQATFMRAFAYFQLANTYGKPAMVTSVAKTQEEFYPSNEDVTKDMVYQFVEEELAKAIPMLPISYDAVSGPDQGQTGRATRGAANGLMGRLLLYQGRYSDAIPYFDAIINSGEYSLAPVYQDIFSGDPGLEQADPGKIFWADFTNSDNPIENWQGDPSVNWKQFTAVTPTYSYVDFWDFNPTTFLYEEMRKELTLDGKLDPRFQATIASYEPQEGDTIAWGVGWPDETKDNFYIAKHTYANLGGGNAFTAGFNYPIIRYADVLLMQAECLANTGNIPGAAALVQQVRNRANLADREGEFAGYSLEEFMDQLSHERIMELALEGHRWHDIIRWGWLDDASKLAELQDHDPEFDTYTPGREVLPIALNELNRNFNLVGNSAN